MQTKQINKSININASKENVWLTLFDNELFKIWCAEFSEGSFAVTDWNVGSKVEFKDASNSGIVGKIVANKPHEYLEIEYTAELVDGKEKYDSESAKALIGAKESYKLTDNGDWVHLETSAPMTEDMYDFMEEAWERAINKVKELAENLQQLEKEGFKDLTACPLPTSESASEHTHDEHTVHIILKGELKITDKEGEKVYKAGQKVEFPAGTTHIAVSEGGSMIVGWK